MSPVMIILLACGLAYSSYYIGSMALSYLKAKEYLLAFIASILLAYAVFTFVILMEDVRHVFT